MEPTEIVIFGTDTPASYHPESILQVLNVPPVSEANIGCERLYRGLFMPSFHPEICITVQASSDYLDVTLVTMQTNLWYYGSYLQRKASGKWSSEHSLPAEPRRWEETRHCSGSLVVGFLSKMEALQPESLLDLEALIVDGMMVQSEYWDVSGQHNSFHTMLANYSDQYQFVYEIYKLATEVLREEKSIRVLEQIHRYLGLGLPVKDLKGHPYCVRIFGTLSFSHQEELERFFKGLSKSKPLLMDMSNFEGMGTLLYPTFQQFIRRRRSAPTVWWASGKARRHLEALGIPASRIFDTCEDALERLSRQYIGALFISWLCRLRRWYEDR